MQNASSSSASSWKLVFLFSEEGASEKGVLRIELDGDNSENWLSLFRRGLLHLEKFHGPFERIEVLTVISLWWLTKMVNPSRNNL